MINCRYCKNILIKTSKKGYKYYYCSYLSVNIRNSQIPNKNCPYIRSKEARDESNI